MAKRSVLIQGHPDARTSRFGHLLADACAPAVGHEVRRPAVTELEFSPPRSREDYENGKPPEAIQQCLEAIARAEHPAVFFPLWLGAMPALLKAFIEPALVRFRYRTGPTGRTQKLLTGKSALS